MKIEKVYNNNCVAVLKNDAIAIVTGAGVGFGRREGDILDHTKVEREFMIVDQDRKEFEALLQRIPVEYYDTSRHIVAVIEDRLNIQFNDHIAIALTDHIYHAIQRAKEGLMLPNILSDDIGILYPDLYNMACWARAYIEYEYQVQLQADEITYITMHLVNGTQKYQSKHAQKLLNFSTDIMHIIENTLGTSILKETQSYKRMMVHLRYLADRIFTDSKKRIDDSQFHLGIVFETNQFDLCIQYIEDYIMNEYNYVLTQSERIYLKVHLSQLTKRQSTM